MAKDLKASLTIHYEELRRWLTNLLFSLTIKKFCADKLTDDLTYD